MTRELDIKALITQINRPEHAAELDSFLQSFDKRGKYCDTYYEWFLGYLDKGNLMRERIGMRNNWRTEYEAVAVAFVANLHAMIDSIPWFVYCSVEPLKYQKNGKDVYITENQCGWTENFSNLLKFPYLSDFKKSFDSFKSDENFKLLRAISNQNKHKHLIRISNNLESLSFEIVNPKNGLITYQDCKEFFARMHDNLVPLAMDLIALLGKARQEAK